MLADVATRNDEPAVLEPPPTRIGFVAVDDGLPPFPFPPPAKVAIVVLL
jgi:hypothetical protein